MFTGIIEELGKISQFEQNKDNAKIEIQCSKVLEEIKLGDSICVNGVCTTVRELNKNSFKADLSEETLKVTNFSKSKVGDSVNLERALTLKERLNGHIVNGHVDCICSIISILKSNEFYNFRFKLNRELKKYLVKKGSVTINGISLTIANISENEFECAIIPHTYENTNLSTLKIGDFVNLETDILAKYVEKILLIDKIKESNINENFLRENGFC